MSGLFFMPWNEPSWPTASQTQPAVGLQPNAHYPMHLLLVHDASLPPA